MMRVHRWAAPLIAARSYSQLAWSVADLFWFTVVTLVLLVIVQAALTNLLLDRKIRQTVKGESRVEHESQQTASDTAVPEPPEGRG